jgi:hypothetical protein
MLEPLRQSFVLRALVLPPDQSNYAEMRQSPVSVLGPPAVPRDILQRISKADSRVSKKTTKRKTSSIQSLANMPRFLDQDVGHSGVLNSSNAPVTLPPEPQTWTTVSNTTSMPPSTFIPYHTHQRDNRSQLNLPAIISRNDFRHLTENTLGRDNVPVQGNGRQEGQMYGGCQCYNC